jgi:hypothetical protein
MRSITSAWTCEQRGVDPLPSNPCDPLRRPANYPRVWLLPSRLGLGDGATQPLAIANASVFFAAVLLFVGRLRLWEGVVVAVAVCSPAVMMGVERGNVDLTVFAVLLVALMLFRRQRPVLRIASHALFLLAAVLKIFPVFAFTTLLQQRRRWRIAAAAVALLFATVVALTWEDLETIRRVVPQEIHLSYGAGVLADAIVQSATLHLGWPDQHNEQSVANWLSLVVVATGLAIAVACRRPLSSGSELRLHSWRSDAFIAGASIYVATYAVLHNYDYRLACLLLTLPQLLVWAAPSGRRVNTARFGLITVLLVLLLGARDSYGFAYEEAINWVAFVYLSAVLIHQALDTRKTVSIPVAPRAVQTP